MCSQVVLELYDTSPTGDPGKLQCMFTLPTQFNYRSSAEVYSGDSYHYSPSTFFTRPEDRILTIFVDEISGPIYPRHPGHITLIVVFVSTLLRLSESRHFIEWAEWKQYAWVADDQEASNLFRYGAFISSSRIIHLSVPQKQQGVRTLEVTTFRPCLAERRLHIPGYTSDDLCDGEPCHPIGRKASLDVQVEDDEDPEVMMTEDNIILMTVRYLTDDSFRC